ncbi:MAG: hypothetical protein VX830_13845 [Candidatus Poribacteria bacterium]|nr:hypothetical protein [Candidatus Poribacteria bacterium]
MSGCGLPFSSISPAQGTTLGGRANHGDGHLAELGIYTGQRSIGRDQLRARLIKPLSFNQLI